MVMGYVVDSVDSSQPMTMTITEITHGEIGNT